jgi:hypothetical protein
VIKGGPARAIFGTKTKMLQKNELMKIIDRKILKWLLLCWLLYDLKYGLAEDLLPVKINLEQNLIL